MLLLLLLVDDGWVTRGYKQFFVLDESPCVTQGVPV